MLDNARDLLGDAGQIAPMSDTLARVTYRGGGFRMLDVGGFATAPDDDLPAKVREWVRHMLLVDGTLALPEDLLPIVWATAADDVAVRDIGDGLVEGAVFADGSVVTRDHQEQWGANVETVTRHARSNLARHQATPETITHDGRDVTVLRDPAGSASGWALFPNLLKSVTGHDGRQIVFLPDPATCVVVAEDTPDAFLATAAFAHQCWANATNPISDQPWVRSGPDLVRYVPVG